MRSDPLQATRPGLRRPPLVTDGVFAASAAILFLALLTGGALLVIQVAFSPSTQAVRRALPGEFDATRARRQVPAGLSEAAWAVLDRAAHDAQARGSAGSPLAEDAVAPWWTGSSPNDRPLWYWLGWGLLVAAALGWSLANWHWRRRAGETLDNQVAWVHCSIATAGVLIALGVQWIMLAQAIGGSPLILDYMHLAPPASRRPAVAPATAIPGDPAEGQRLFAMTCLTCHGPRGDGLAGLAPSLRTSEWVQGADESRIAQVIRAGRTADDPANRSGKVMPARGGNPFLTEEQIAHLAAFVNSLPGQSSGGDAAGEGLVGGAAAPTLARWVVPAPAPPPSGWIRLDPARHAVGVAHAAQRDAWRAEQAWQVGCLALVTIHSLWLFGVWLTACQALFGWSLGVSSRRSGQRVAQAIGGCWIGLCSWLVILGVTLWGL